MPDLLFMISLAGTAVFAISGALLGLRKSMDIVGVTFVATLTGVGGGTLRDLLLGALPVNWVVHPEDIIVCIACAVFVSAFNKALSGRRMQWLLYADAIGLALFAVLGAAKAEAAGAHPLVVILFGAMSATFGGIIRDVVCNETPVVFSQDIYISAALVGGAVYIGLPESIDFELRASLGMVSALALRLLAMRYAWSLPFPKYPDNSSQ
jgi:uncharacterized membrane protein YeiH